MTSSLGSDFIKKFCEKPFPISAISHPENHFYDFLGMLHILLVKNHKKKFHLTAGDTRNVLKVSNTLKIPCKQINRPLFLDKYQSNIIDEQILDLLVGTARCTAQDFCFSMNEKSITELSDVPLTASSTGDLFEYPKCCIDWFVQSQWEDREIAYTAMPYQISDYDSMENQMVVNGIHLFAEECWHQVDELVQRRKKIALKNNLKVREKFPFVEHQACDNCVDNVDSPTEKLSNKYAEFAEKKYPDLYNLIISESKKEIKNISEDWEDAPLS